MLFLAAVMGAAAVYLTHDWLQRQQPRSHDVVALPQPPPAPTIPTVTVVVARSALHFGDELSRDNLKAVAWPAEAVPQESFAAVDDVLAGDQARVALRDIGANETVLKTRVSGFGGRATLSAVVNPDMRAFTIRVDEYLGVAGFVLPGDRVDVIYVRPEGAAQEARSSTPPVSDILLQNLLVLAVDQIADHQKEKPIPARAVTLEVSSVDAQKLTLASQVGTLTLALRNLADARHARAGTVTVSGLLARDAPAGAGASPSHTIRVFRGTEEKPQSVEPEASPPATVPAPARLRPPPSSERVASAPGSAGAGSARAGRD
jgi:pilus assembly protein CpaB